MPGFGSSGRDKGSPGRLAGGLASPGACRKAEPAAATSPICWPGQRARGPQCHTGAAVSEGVRTPRPGWSHADREPTMPRAMSAMNVPSPFAIDVARGRAPSMLRVERVDRVSQRCATGVKCGGGHVGRLVGRGSHASVVARGRVAARAMASRVPKRKSGSDPRANLSSEDFAPAARQRTVSPMEAAGMTRNGGGRPSLHIIALAVTAARAGT